MEKTLKIIRDYEFGAHVSNIEAWNDRPETTITDVRRVAALAGI
jgi:hypothetical protein